MNDAYRGFKCVNLHLQFNRSSLIVVRQTNAFFYPNDLEFSGLNQRVPIFFTSGTGIAFSVWQRPNYQRLEEGGSIIMKWVKALKRKITALKSAQTDDAGRWETAAMVYGGDIYAVLVRHRAMRQLVRVDSSLPDYRRDAGWPFIR